MVEEIKALTRSLSGIGVDEQSVISTLGRWRPEHRHSFRKTCSAIFRPDGHHHTFERWNDDHIRQLEVEFARFRKAVILRAMHPWERDARGAHHVIHEGHPAAVLVEIACTRSSEELLGARRAYHALFHHSLEEDVAHRVKDPTADLLVRLVSAYRYEGPHVHDHTAKSEAKALGDALSGGKKLVEKGEVIRILTTRSKTHLRLVFKYYKETYGRPLDEALAGDPVLQETVQCLDSPPKYFSKVLENALRDDADEHAKAAFTRVIVTRADVDMEEIKKEYQKLSGISLEGRIEKAIHGNYRDFLLNLVRGGSH